VDFSESSPSPDKGTLAPWRSPLAHALHRNRSLPNARYAQLATVDRSGLPANRTIVVRGFWLKSNQLRFITDLRSAKVEQLGRAELCWYFPKTREQFRIAGELRLVTETCPDPELARARQLLWQEISDGARAQFAWPTPGEVRGSEGFDRQEMDDRQPHGNFCLLLLDPISVDHLELRGEPQCRRLYRLGEGGWEAIDVNP
jgi:pyridoxamine 5'-phosphate oxidase